MDQGIEFQLNGERISYTGSATTRLLDVLRDCTARVNNAADRQHAPLPVKTIVDNALSAQGRQVNL